MRYTILALKRFVLSISFIIGQYPRVIQLWGVLYAAHSVGTTA